MTLNAILCEGAAEQAILDILIKNDALIIKKTTLFEDQTLRVRCGDSFFNKYMRRELDEKVTIYRILDSKKENFKLSRNIKKEFSGKYDVYNVITSPEIEMLIIISEGKYNEFMKLKSKMKPSEYCKQMLKFKNVKDYKFIDRYFSDISKLKNAIAQYHSLKGKYETDDNSLTLYDLLENK